MGIESSKTKTQNRDTSTRHVRLSHEHESIKQLERTARAGLGWLTGMTVTTCTAL